MNLLPDLHPTPPAQFADRLGSIRADRWQRMERGLYLLSTTQLNLVQELAERLAGTCGSRVVSRSHRDVFYRYLPEAGLAAYQVLPYFHSGLAAARLTSLGQEVCRALGWQPQASEWERLIRYHQGDETLRHTAMILAFAREARVRHYKVFVCPARSVTWPERFFPDVFILDRQHRRAYVEVERGQGEKEQKWALQQQVQRFAAVVTLTSGSRSFLVERILAQGIPVWATDLETLRRLTLAGTPGSLWIERWRSPKEKSWSW